MPQVQQHSMSTRIVTLVLLIAQLLPSTSMPLDAKCAEPLENLWLL